MDLDPWDLREPMRCLNELAQHHPPRPGRVVVGLVEHPSRIQRLVNSCVAFDEFPWPAGESAGRRLLHDVAHGLFNGLDDCRRIPQHSFVTMLARSGRVVFTGTDFEWLLGWRYSNHLLPVYQGDMFLVTEHGCRSLTYDVADRSPRIIGYPAEVHSTAE